MQYSYIYNFKDYHGTCANCGKEQNLNHLLAKVLSVNETENEFLLLLTTPRFCPHCGIVIDLVRMYASGYNISNDKENVFVRRVNG